MSFPVPRRTVYREEARRERARERGYEDYVMIQRLRSREMHMRRYWSINGRFCGKGALYASPTNADDWFHHFVRLRADECLRAALIRNGRERAPLFSWQKSAEQYLIAMARLDGIAAPADDAAPSWENTDQTVRSRAVHLGECIV